MSAPIAPAPALGSAKGHSSNHRRQPMRMVLRQLDRVLGELEDEQERGQTRVSIGLEKRYAGLVPGLVAGIPILDALELVFKQQEACLTPSNPDPTLLAVKTRSQDSSTGGQPPIQSTDGIGRRSAWVGSDHHAGRRIDPTLDPDKARVLTNQIKAGLHQTSVLLLEAHDKKAWLALGYGSWSRYVRTEFGMSRSRSYELLEHGRVIESLALAASMSGIPDISPYAARQIKPHLGRIKFEIGRRSAGLTDRQANQMVSDVIDGVRAEQSRRYSDDRSNGTKTVMARGSGSPDIDLESLLLTVEYLAKLPPPTAVAKLVSAKTAVRLALLPHAVSWLNQFAAALDVENPCV